MRTMIGKETIVILMLFMAGYSLAQDLSGIPGVYADIGLGTRPLGMGGAYVAAADDENGARWNPAALTDASSKAAAFTWTKQFNLVPYNYIAGVYPREHAGLGLYLETSGDAVLRENTIGLGIGLKGENLKPGKVGQFFAKRLPGVSVGATAKFRWASFGNNSPEVVEGLDPVRGQVKGNAIGFGFDFGLIWKPSFSNRLQLAFVARDVVNTLVWDSHSDDTPTKGSYTEAVPASIVIGAAWKPYDSTLLTFDLKPAVYSDTASRFALGGEYRFFKDILSLRAGIAQSFGVVDMNRDLTTGLGVKFPVGGYGKVQAGFGYLFNRIQNTPRVGLIFTW